MSAMIEATPLIHSANRPVAPRRLLRARDLRRIG
jgi:hypothetical protein